MARWRRIDVSTEILKSFFSGGDKYKAAKLRGGIPVDAELAEVTYHRREELVSFVFMHPSFEDVNVCMEIPAITPTISTLERACPTCEAPCVHCGGES